MFVNRVKELAWLNQSILALEKGKGINAALLGLRRIGKTELMLEFRKKKVSKNIIMPYLNIQSSMSSPNRFCIFILHYPIRKIERGLLKNDGRYLIG
ncbi:prokaryotic ATPase, AAA superfamily [Candidatus Magnetomorum sp. HK-1]|nr:prokaryotic ATPase, AAA superfamily [Candidatus Magnetomorum sp. HK-1]